LEVRTRRKRRRQFGERGCKLGSDLRPPGCLTRQVGQRTAAEERFELLPFLDGDSASLNLRRSPPPPVLEGRVNLLRPTVVLGNANGIRCLAQRSLRILQSRPPRGR